MNESSCENRSAPSCQAAMHLNLWEDSTLQHPHERKKEAKNKNHSTNSERKAKRRTQAEKRVP